MRLTCVQSTPARGCGGMLPQKNFKPQGFAGALWSGFGTSELRVCRLVHMCESDGLEEPEAWGRG